MQDSHRITLYLVCALMMASLRVSSQTTERVPLPEDTVIRFLSGEILSRSALDDSLLMLLQKYEWQDEDLYHTPISFYKKGELSRSYYAYANILNISPQIINSPEHQVPIVRSFSYMHRIYDITDRVWDILAQNFNRTDQVALPNAFFTALDEQEKYQIRQKQSDIEALILSANTEADETKLSMDFNEEKILVSRREKLSGESFYFSQLKNGRWTPLTKDPFLSLIEFTESAASIDASGRFVIYTKCMSRAWDAVSGGGCDLWFATYIDDSTWAPAQKYFGGVNTPAYEGLACFSIDGKKMYFSSDREGGYGGKDIWYSTWDGIEWSKPINSGPTVNSKYDEFSPYMAEDGSSLFFISNKSGSADIYYSYQGGAFKNAQPEKLPYPINTDDHEISCHVISQTGRIVVATNGKSGRNDFELMIHDLPKKYRPKSKASLSGQMLQLYTLKPIYAEYGRTEDFEWTEEDQTFTNQGNGWFYWELNQHEKLNQIVIKSINTLISTTRDMPIEEIYHSPTLRWNFLLKDE